MEEEEQMCVNLGTILQTCVKNGKFIVFVFALISFTKFGKIQCQIMLTSRPFWQVFEYEFVWVE